MVNKFILAAMATIFMATTAYADVVRITKQYNAVTNQYRINFYDADGTRTSHTGDRDQAFGAVLSAAINSYGGASGVVIETIVDTAGNTIETTVVGNDMIDGTVTANGTYVVTLSNGTVYRYNVDVPTTAPTVDITSDNAQAIADARARGTAAFTQRNATNSQINTAFRDELRDWSNVYYAPTVDASTVWVNRNINRNNVSTSVTVSDYHYARINGSATINSHNNSTNTIIRFDQTASTSNTYLSYNDRTVVDTLVTNIVDHVATEAFNTGFNEGWHVGFHQGYQEGYTDGFQNGYRIGYTDGVNSVQ